MKEVFPGATYTNVPSDSARIRANNEVERLTIRPKVGVPFRCVLDKILLEEIPVEENKIVTAGGLSLDRSERFEKKPMTGRVLAVGDGVPMAGVLMPMPYKIGQVVRCSEYGRDYINLATGENGMNAFQKGETRTFLIRVADTHGELEGK